MKFLVPILGLAGLYFYFSRKRLHLRSSKHLVERLIPNIFLKSTPHKEPIFFIGFHKTGSSFYSHIFQELGYRVMHDSHWRTGSISVIEQYDAFFDGCLHSFEEMYRRYPRAKFVLNTRPLRDWLLSRLAFSDWGSRNLTQWERRMITPVTRLIWGNDAYYDPARIEFWIQERRSYHQRVLNFFADKHEQLLILNLEDPEKLEKLGAFLSLDLQTPSKAIGKRNVSPAERKRRYEALVNQVLERCRVSNPNELL